MNPALIALVLAAALLALLPVWRLHVAGWSRRALFAAWLGYVVGIVLAVRFTAAVRFLLPILVVAYVAPFIVGPERLARVMRRRAQAEPPRMKDVTPPERPGLPVGDDDDADDPGR